MPLRLPRPTARRAAPLGLSAAPLGLSAALLGLSAALVVSGCTGSGATTTPSAAAVSTSATSRALQVATGYLKAWSDGQDSAAAALTTDPAAAVKLLSTTRSQLDLGNVNATPGTPRPTPDGGVDLPATVTVAMTGLGQAGWRIVVHVAGKDPLVQFSPTLVHPALSTTTRLRRDRTAPMRASILDRDGKLLTVPQKLYAIGVQPSRLADPAAAYRLLGSLPDHPDVAALKQRVAAAPPDQFVSVITLREAQFAPFQTRLQATEGIIWRERMATLPLVPGLASTVLGRLTPASTLDAATRQAAGPLVAVTDDVGTSGLQRTGQQQLAGTPGGELVVVSRRGGDPLRVLQSFPALAGTPLRTTLSLRAQQVAEAALSTVPQAGALVAVQPSTGQLLAVADQGVATQRQDGINRALNGRYPPGSTFKVISAAALLGSGVSPDATVACPPAITVNGRRFTNVEGEPSSTSEPFITDFAISCNTAFISLRDRVAGAALPNTAPHFGFGLDATLGVTSFGGSVPTPSRETELAATMIGQGRVVASPLSMAVVAATVAAGRARTPVLVTGPGQPPVAAAPPPADPAVIADLRSFMAATVARGTATGLRGVATGAKTGTAEFGSTPGPNGALPTDAWMIAYRGDLAVAVLVADGSTGARTAGPIVRRFLQAIG